MNREINFANDNPTSNFLSIRALFRAKMQGEWRS